MEMTIGDIYGYFLSNSRDNTSVAESAKLPCK